MNLKKTGIFQTIAYVYTLYKNNTENSNKYMSLVSNAFIAFLPFALSTKQVLHFRL